MKQTFSDRLTEKYLHFLFKHPLRLFVTGICFMVILTPGIPFLTSDFSFRSYTHPESPKLISYDLYEKNFGNDDNVMVIVNNPQGVMNRETLIPLRELEKELNNLPGTRRLESIFNGSVIHSTNDAIEIKGLISSTELEKYSESDFLNFKNEGLKSPNIHSILLSSDATVTVLYLFLRPTLQQNQQLEIYHYTQEVEKIVSAHQKNFPNAQLKIFGSAYISKSLIEVSKNDQLRLGPIILLLFALVSFIALRNINGVLISVFVIICNILCCLGIQSYLKIPINSFTSALGIIITTITTGALIHIIAGYYRYYRRTGDSKAALIHTYRMNFIPTLLTTLTTSVGFICLANKDLMPVYQLGILLGIGNAFSWIMIITLVGPILNFLNKQKTPYKLDASGLPETLSEPHKKDSEFSIRYVNYIGKHKFKIINLMIFLCAISIIAATQLEVSMNPFKQFSDNVPIVKTQQLVKDKFTHSMAIEFLLDTGKVDGAKDINLLNRLLKLEELIYSDKRVHKHVSITEVIKEINKIFNSGNQSFYKLPESSEAVAQYLLLISLSDNGKIKNLMSNEGRYLKFTLFTTEENSNKLLEQMTWVEDLAKEQNLNLFRTGKVPLFMSLTEVVFNLIGSSAIISMLLIGFIMYLLVRNTKLALISMIPNVIPLIYGAGIMYLLSYGIDIGITLVFSVCLGIAVDDTIHFIHHYTHLIQKGKTPEEALQNIVVNLFPTIISTTLILSVGFGVLSFADFLPNHKFGVMTGVILTLAVFADLFMLPAILLIKKTK